MKAFMVMTGGKKDSLWDDFLSAIKRVNELVQNGLWYDEIGIVETSLTRRGD